MAHITIDTERDSPSTIQHVIELLQEELAKKTQPPVMTATNTTESQQSYQEEEQPRMETYGETQTTTQGIQEDSSVSNPFEMFGSGLPSSGGVQPKQKLDVPVGTAIEEEAIIQPTTQPTTNQSNDLFGAFDDEPKREQQEEQKQHIILEPPKPREEPIDVEGSARFAKQVMAQDLINDASSAPKKDSFFKDLDQW